MPSITESLARWQAGLAGRDIPADVAQATLLRVLNHTGVALAAEHGVEEIAVLTTVHDPEARRRSYTLLAREFGLDGAAAGTAAPWAAE